MITGTGSAFSGGDSRKRRLVSWLVRRLYWAGLAGVHVVFFQNPDDERLFRSLGHRRPAAPAHPAGRRIGRGPGPLQPRCRCRPGRLTFLLIGRVIRDKGVAEYVEAARRVREVHPEARFQLLGPLDVNPTAISREELDGWVATGAIEYLGRTPDVRPEPRLAHVCVLPSYGEGMPRSVLEAMAMARPVITTDVPGCRETVVPGRNGFLVPARDPVALADAMLRLIEEPDLLAPMGLEGRRLAEERFDVRASTGRSSRRWASCPRRRRAVPDRPESGLREPGRPDRQARRGGFRSASEEPAGRPLSRSSRVVRTLGQEPDGGTASSDSFSW